MKRKLAIWVAPQNGRRFLVSSCGRILSLEFNDGYHRNKPPYEPKIHQRKDGQCFFSIGKKKGTKTAVIQRVHQTVAQCFLPNPNNHKTVDHIDGNRSNNELANLRWANQKIQGRAFRKKAHGKYSKYRGVTFDITRKNKPWLAQLQKNGKQYHGGYHETENQAAMAYNKLAKSHGFFVECLNHV